jgi:hypothetical protein
LPLLPRGRSGSFREGREGKVGGRGEVMAMETFVRSRDHPGGLLRFLLWLLAALAFVKGVRVLRLWGWLRRSPRAP